MREYGLGLPGLFFVKYPSIFLRSLASVPRSNPANTRSVMVEGKYPDPISKISLLILLDSTIKAAILVWLSHSRDLSFFICISFFVKIVEISGSVNKTSHSRTGTT